MRITVILLFIYSAGVNSVIQAASIPLIAIHQGLPGFASGVEYEPQVVGYAEGYPIYHMGEYQFLGVSPDFSASRIIQVDNTNPQAKIRPRTTSNIANNFIGTTPPRLPRSEIGDEFPWLPCHMIDGDRTTGWLGGGWVRFDFSREILINAIRVWPIFHRPPEFERPGKKPPPFSTGTLPATLSISAATDASHWRTVCSVSDIRPSPDQPAVHTEFQPILAKQVRIAIEHLNWGFGEVEILDQDGKNVSLITRGTNVLVDNTNWGPAGKRESAVHMWPLHWNLGAKWMRVGYWNDATNWSRVERVKGEYHLDGLAEAAIKTAAEKGLCVTLTLGYGNLLYQSDGRSIPRPGQHYEVTWTYPVPTSREAVDGFCNFCRFMARRFRGFVNYFEIWNEEDSPEIMSCTPQQFATLVLAAARAIKEVIPDARIILGGTGSMNLEWTRNCLEDTGLASEIDVIAYHPYQMSSLPEDSVLDSRFSSYSERFENFKQIVRSYGFKGGFHANEQAWKAQYPPNKFIDPQLPLWSTYDVSELTKAKYLARTVMTHTSLGVPVFWNESWTGPGTLLRHGGGSPEMSPEASFYVMRTLGTVLDEANSEHVNIIWSGLEGLPLVSETYSFPTGDLLLAGWLRTVGTDDFEGVKADLYIPNIYATAVIGIDPLNGFEQPLTFAVSESGTEIKGLVIRDYPLLIRLVKRR